MKLQPPKVSKNEASLETVSNVSNLMNSTCIAALMDVPFYIRIQKILEFSKNI